MISEVKFNSALLVIIALAILSGCAETERAGDANAVGDANVDEFVDLPLILEPISSQYRPLVHSGLGTPFESWLFDAEAGVMVPSSLADSVARFRFTNSNPLVQVVNRRVSPGDSVRFSVTMRATDGIATLTRVLISRDCSLEAEEFSQQIGWISETTTLEVWHTFAASYDCFKVQVQVLNGSDSGPRYLDIYRPSVN